MEDHHADPHDAVNWRREISDRQTETEKVVSSLAVTVSRIEQSITDLAGAVKGLASDQRIDRKPFQWSVAISFAGLVLMVAGSFSTLMLIPVRDQQQSNTAQIAALNKSDLDTAQWRGLVDGRFEERTKRLEALEQASKEDIQRHFDALRNGSYVYGRQEAYEGRLDRLSGRLDRLSQRTYEAKP